MYAGPYPKSLNQRLRKLRKTWRKSLLIRLAFYPHKSLNIDSMQWFLCHEDHCNSPEDQTPLWMGSYPATCILDNKKKEKSDILSVYAGFFYDELEKNITRSLPTFSKTG